MDSEHDRDRIDARLAEIAEERRDASAAWEMSKVEKLRREEYELIVRRREIMSPEELEQERLRSQLETLISAYSEDRWAAGWMAGIEHELWCTGGLWHILAARLGEWPSWQDHRHNIEWLSLAEFDKLHQANPNYPNIEPFWEEA